MAAIELSLFDWRAVDARSDLDRFYLVRDHLPDAELVQYLEVMRGQGRDDYPVRAMWNALLAGVVFQHPSIEALIRELGRNPALREACGFAVLPIQKKPLTQLVPDADTGRMTIAYAAAEAPHAAVPGSWNFSRFLANVIELEETLGMVTEMITTLREQLMAVLPEFGCHLGYDGKAIDSHSTGRVSRTIGTTSDPDADWGKHETSGVDASGKPWKKIKSWFGYGVHLIADTQYEIPVAMHLTPASHAEQIELRVMLQETFAETPELAERCRDFSADRGLDSAETKTLLWDTYGIRPLIDTRELWREEKQHPDYDPASPSPARCFRSGSTPLSIPKKAASTAFARRPENSAIWPSRASRPIAMHSNTAARPPPMDWSARVVNAATRPAGSRPGTMGASYGSASTTMIGASSYRPRMAAPVGSAVTIGVAPWSESITVLITASASSGILSAAWRRCRPGSAWRWRS